MRAFTARFIKGRARQLFFTCDIENTASTAGFIKNPNNYKCLWDTGATSTAISINLAQKLKLLPVGKINITHGGGSHLANKYLVNVHLPNGVCVKDVVVMELPLNDFDVIIGMDIITLGDFSITNVNGNTVFSFRIPSTKEIDYVAETNASKSVKKPNSNWRKKGKRS